MDSVRGGGLGMSGQMVAHGVVIWLILLIALIGYRLLTGSINLRGLISTGDDHVTPERVQLLITSITSVVVYANDSVDAGELVEPSLFVVSGFAGSHVVYLVGKYARYLGQMSTR